MSSIFPSVTELRDRLARLSNAELDELGRHSGVSVHTLAKVRRGETANPGLETVRAFYPHLIRLHPPTTGEVYAGALSADLTEPATNEAGA